MGCGGSHQSSTTVRQFSTEGHESGEEGEGVQDVREEDVSMTEERRMIATSLGEGEDDWLTKEREKLKKLHALPPIRETSELL